MSANPNALNGFEVPVTDFARAKALYETVLATTIQAVSKGPQTLGFLSSHPYGVGGAIAVPKTEIGNGFGFFAHFIDSEGNKVGLHSRA